MATDPLSLRRVLSNFATGVTVVSTEHLDGGYCGLTANAFSSVSLVPPLVLVCVDRATQTYPCLVSKGFFVASFLAAHQHELAVKFAERRDDKFDGVPHRLGITGAPILERAVGYVECRIEQELEGGDHAIFLSRVEEAGAEGGEPLVFFRGGYAHLD